MSIGWSCVAATEVAPVARSEFRVETGLGRAQSEARITLTPTKATSPPAATTQPGIEVMVGEAMSVLTLWARGDVETAAVINEMEQRAGVTFSEDRRTVSPAPPPPTS